SPLTGRLSDKACRRLICRDGAACLITSGAGRETSLSTPHAAERRQAAGPTPEGGPRDFYRRALGLPRPSRPRRAVLVPVGGSVREFVVANEGRREGKSLRCSLSFRTCGTKASA